MKTTDVDVVVIGAGITGLVTAYQLIKAGKKVVLIEKQNRTGGQVETVKVDGFVFESGPNTGVLNNVQVMELFEQLAPHIQPETAQKESKVRLIWKGKSFHALPSGLISAVATPLFTFTDKIRICFEPWRKRGNDPMESIADLVKRRLGKSFFEYAIDPFISGVYAGDPNRLVTRFALPKMHILEQKYGSFIRGAIQLKKLPKSDAEKKVTKQVFSTPGGFGNLTQALTAEIGLENMILNAGEVQLSPLKEGWEILLPNKDLIYRAKKVISTIPAYALPSLLPFADKQDMDLIANMPYAPVLQVGVGIRELSEKVPMAFGGLIPSCENKTILGILFQSSCFPNRAPKDGATLAFFMGGRRHPELLNWSDEEIASTVKNALVEMLGFPKDYQPAAIRIFRHARAIPQYEADSEERLAAIERIQMAHSGLILAGGIRDGIGLGDRIKQATLLALQA